MRPDAEQRRQQTTAMNPKPTGNPEVGQKKCYPHAGNSDVFSGRRRWFSNRLSYEPLERRWTIQSSRTFGRATSFRMAYNTLPRQRVLMQRTITLELQLPKDWKEFRLPKALDERLQELLERQNREGKLAPRERQEAKALTELVDLLSLMKARAVVQGS